uniref:MACD2 deacetylase n=1 Tax=Anas platyrhynchos platyrhynchos TaxID=8840 RepID=A0A493T306_ANAPP
MHFSPPGRAGLGSRGPRRPQPGRRRVATRRSSGPRRQPGSRGGAAPPRAGRHRAAGPRAPSPGAPGAPRPLMSHQAPPAHTEGPGCGASSPCIPVPVPIPTRAPPLQAPPGRLARRARSGVGGGGGGRRRGLLSGGWRSQRAVGRGAGAAGVSCWSEACPSRQAPCGAGERRLHGAGGGGGGGGGRQQQRAARRPLHPPPVSLGNLQLKAAASHSAMYPGNKRKKIWREEKERLLKMTLEERRKEYSREYVALKDIPTWMEEMKSKNESDGENAKEEQQGKKSLSEKVSLYRGDITLLEVDAIVNADTWDDRVLFLLSCPEALAMLCWVKRMLGRKPKA